MNPMCPECDRPLTKENGNWYCEQCDLEFNNEELGMEEDDDDADTDQT